MVAANSPQALRWQYLFEPGATQQSQAVYPGDVSITGNLSISGTLSFSSISFPNGTIVTDTANGTLKVSNSGGTQSFTMAVGASNSATFQGSIFASAASNIGWTGRSLMASPADGQIQFSNNAGTNVQTATIGAGGILTFTNSIFTNGQFQVGGSQNFGFISRSLFTSPADGQFKVTNNAGTAVASQIGTATNDNAVAGGIGEFIQSSVAQGSAVALTTATPANVTSMSLTAGDWDVWANAWYNPSASMTLIQVGISTVSATLPTPPSGGGYNALATTFAGVTNSSLPCQMRLSLNATTTVFLVTYATFASGTVGGYGSIQARRRR